MIQKLILLFTMLMVNLISSSYAQAPARFSYQATVRDTAGNLLVNRYLSMRISLLSGSPNGTIEYQETHQVTSNTNGLVSLIIGDGSQKYGKIDSIKWGQAAYFISLEVDLNGGNSYKLMGSAPMLSVPYALYASHSGNVAPKGDPGVGITKAEIKNDSLLFTLSDNQQLNAGKIASSGTNNIYLFVEDFGALANDKTRDNSLAIQTAIDSAIRCGKIVYFQKGTYYFKKTILIRKNLKADHDEGIKMLGAGVNQTNLVSLIQSQPLFVMENASIDSGNPIPGYFFRGGYIKNIKFQGTAGTGNCFNINGWWYGLMENIQIVNFGGNAIHMPTRNSFGPPNDPNGNAYTDNYSSFISIRNAQIDNNEGWAYFDERDNTSSDLVCEKTVIASNRKGGIRFGGQSIRLLGCAIAYNGFGSTTGGGLELSVRGNSSHNNFISQIEFDGNNNYHIKMNSVINTTVTNCRFLFHDLIDHTKMSPSNGSILLAADSLYPTALNVNITNNYIRVDYPLYATSNRQKLYFLRFVSHASCYNIVVQNNFYQALPPGFNNYHDFIKHDYYFTSRLGITNNIIIDDPSPSAYSASARGKTPPYFDGKITNKYVDSIGSDLGATFPITLGSNGILNLEEYINYFDTSSRTFKIPESGYYEVDVSLGLDTIINKGSVAFNYYTDNSLFVKHSHAVITSSEDWINDKLILYCYEGEKLKLKLNSSHNYAINKQSKIFIRLIR